MKLFELVRTGDPYNKHGYDVREYENSYKDGYCVFRGDLSSIQGRERTKTLLRRLYPECRIRVAV